jgi:hypothetical protein
MEEASKVSSIRIDDICRTERYYTATLLPYILLHNSFSGLYQFLETLERKNIKARLTENLELKEKSEKNYLLNHQNIKNIEIITEMDVVRDVKFYASWLKGMDNIDIEEADMLRPDVIIVVDELLIVIEAKFFHKASIEKIKSQLREQNNVINRILLRFPGYAFDRYCHIFLSMMEIDPSVIGCDACLTWIDIEQLAKSVLGQEHYVTQRLQKAVALHQLVTPKVIHGKSGSKNYIEKISLPSMIAKCQQEGNRIFVGYTGGVKKLRSVNAEYLKERKLKWDWSENSIPPKEPDNWIKGDVFLAIIKEVFPELLIA